MARKTSIVGKTELAQLMYAARMLAPNPKSPYVGGWPLSRAKFMALVNEQAGLNLTLFRYNAWEMGVLQPRNAETHTKLVKFLKSYINKNSKK